MGHRRSSSKGPPGLATSVALGVALLAAPAAATVEFAPCPQAQGDARFGPWRCDAEITAPQDLVDQVGNIAALSGDVMVLGYAGSPYLDRGELIVLAREESVWKESTRLPVRGRGEVALFGDAIAIADASTIATETYLPPTAVHVYTSDGFAWVQRAMITDDAWARDPRDESPFVPELAHRRAPRHDDARRRGGPGLRRAAARRVGLCP